MNSSRTMPAAPAACATTLLALGAMPPASQISTLPATSSGSTRPSGPAPAAFASAAPKHSARAWRSASDNWSNGLRPALCAKMNGVGGNGARLSEPPISVGPPGTASTAPVTLSWFVAATVASQGTACATGYIGPSLPAEVATNTPAAAAPRNAWSTGSSIDQVPPIEKFSTSTPSATACSIAATESLCMQLVFTSSGVAGSVWVQHTL
ncbi:hypothetical protein OU994_21125 [Pseudoduganella sp. SL102]|nr:hypothetical protein [Pseudoduganella sp. SL102]WBS00796.1 hypothetical protein OU994_21125 [Pseudoduganella sp. SL102]